MAVNDGGPFFPNISIQENKQGTEYCRIGGASMRDWLAGTIAAGYRAGRHINAGAFPSESKLWSSAEVARNAVRDADALIAELSKEQP